MNIEHEAVGTAANETNVLFRAIEFHSIKHESVKIAYKFYILNTYSNTIVRKYSGAPNYRT